MIRQLLFNRGIKTKSGTVEFFNPNLSVIPDPFKLFDVKSAVERIEQAISQSEQIYVFGDFDVDGITASAILWEYLYRERKAKVLPFIPSRVRDGYGMSDGCIQKIIDQDGKLIINNYKDSLQRKCARFFIRKAIGWMIREMARKDPKSAFNFFKKYRGEMSGLSFRDGSRRMPEELREQLGS